MVIFSILNRNFEGAASFWGYEYRLEAFNALADNQNLDRFAQRLDELFE